MKIKVKLNLGIGLLFSMIALLIVCSIIFIMKLSDDTSNILVANYNTLDYSRNMLIATNRGIEHEKEDRLFKQNLLKQQQNITEVGEKELTDKLTFDYTLLQTTSNTDSVLAQINQDITDLMLLNMQAIQRKSTLAQQTADQSIFWVSIIGVICFLIAFILLVNLPGNIANPIRELTESIQEIARQNYSQRVHFKQKNEFGDLATSFNTMAQKLEEYKAGNIEKLLNAKQRIETLIESMSQPVIGVDEQFQVLFINESASQIVHLSKQDAMGKSIHQLALKNDLLRKLIEDIEKDEEGLLLKNASVIKIYADQKESYFQKQLIPIRVIPTGETDSKLIGKVIMLQNITTFKELDFAKTNFIATVSHEFKTPLSSIKMSLQLLGNAQIGTLNAEQSSLIESINDDANRLLSITGELLNMAQLESGVIQLSLLPCDAKEIIQYALAANKLAAEQKQIQLEVKQPNEIDKLQADSEKTAWVLTNLISNAIRYSYENSSVVVSLTEANGMIQFSVQDFGQGIEDQYIDKIFDRYFRIPGTKKEGTGLGLSISKEFIEAQGGTLLVKSEFGAGSIFTINLLKAPK